MTETSENPTNPKITSEQAEEYGNIEPKTGIDFAGQVMPGVSEELDRLEHEDENSPVLKDYNKAFRESADNMTIDELRAANPISEGTKKVLDQITSQRPKPNLPDTSGENTE